MLIRRNKILKSLFQKLKDRMVLFNKIVKVKKVWFIQSHINVKESTKGISLQAINISNEENDE